MDQNSNRDQVSINETARNILPEIVNGEGIVITERNYVVGSNGTGHWFQLREKYCYTGPIRQLVNCKDCSNNSTRRIGTFYQITIDNEIFLIDKNHCVEYNQPIDNSVANKGRYNDFLDPNIFYPENNDYVKQTEQITGMKNKTTPDYKDDEDNNQDSLNKFSTVKKDVGSNKIDENL